MMPIYNPHDLNQDRHCRHEKCPAHTTNFATGIFQDLDLFRKHKAHGFFPVDQPKHGVITIEQDAGIVHGVAPFCLTFFQVVRCNASRIGRTIDVLAID
jgi:hypothetical protein